MDEDTFDNQNSLILGVYRSFEAAGVRVWDLGDVPSHGEKNRTNLHNLNDSQHGKSKAKVYIYAVDYFPLYNSSNTRRFSETSSTGRTDNDCQSSVLEPEDEIMDDVCNISDNLAYSETILNVSNSSPKVSENICASNVTTKKLDFEASISSNSTEYENTERSNNISTDTKCTSSTTQSSKIKIMIVDQTKKRNLSTVVKSEKEVITQPKTNDLKKAQVEKKQKICKDPLQLKKMRHIFKDECDVCGVLSQLIPKCTYHNDEKYLFYRRKRLALSGNEETIQKIDQLLPKTYQLISCNRSNNETYLVSSLATQWHTDMKEPKVEQKKFVDLRPVHKFFKDFSMA